MSTREFHIRWDPDLVIVLIMQQGVIKMRLRFISKSSVSAEVEKKALHY